MATTLRLKNTPDFGSDLDLLDQTNYMAQAEGWTPQVTFLRDSDFGGVGPYSEIDEGVAVLVNGASFSARYTNVEALAVAMDQATRWARGENVAPVQLEYGPEGNAAGALITPILGRPRGGENPFGLSGVFGEASNAIPDNALRFRRRGLWMSASTTGKTASAANTSQVMTASGFTAHPRNLLTLELATTLGTTTGSGVLLVSANPSSSITFVNGTVTTGGTDCAATNDAANNPRQGTNVMRFTPTAANTARDVWSIRQGFPGNLPSAYSHFYALVRNNTADTTFQMRLRATSGFTTFTPASTVYTDWVDIPPGVTTPQVINLGTIPGETWVTTFMPEVRANLSGGGRTFDIDCFAVLTSLNENARAITLPLIPAVNAASTIRIDHRYAVSPTPRISIAYSVDTYDLAYSGNALLTMGNVTSVTAALLATAGSAWRLPNTVTMQAQQTNTYLVPR